MYGYNRIEFLKQIGIAANGDKILIDGKNVYYYPHNQTACYYCIVNASDASIDVLDQNDNYYDKKIQAYYNALAREKNKLVKLSNYINNSARQTSRILDND